MITFFIGMTILVGGGLLYGIYCQKVFGPDDRKTPAITHTDGVDFVPMKTWRNSLIQFLNIAGTGPILGPIQGILFGPIAFITIPIGCVIGGAVHDYMSGMISIRNNGVQMPQLIRKYLGTPTFHIYNIFVCLLMLLVGAVFIYTPGDLIVTQLFDITAAPTNPVVWITYGIIFVYYLVATLFPIDQIIGRIYPFFGILLILSSVLIGIGMFLKGYQLTELSKSNWMGLHPDGLKFIPIFFVTVACGIVSGFHSTQSTMIARSVTSEKSGKTIFFYMMLAEGFVAMIWAGAAMGIYHKVGAVPAEQVGTPAVIGLIAKDILGNWGGIIALIGVIVLPITSGDTALRALRLMLADYLHYDQKKKSNRIILTTCIFLPVIAILIFAKLNSSGFNILWRYFAWSNQTIAVFTFAMITIYLIRRRKNFLIALIPGTFYMYIITSYILNAKIGFNLNWTLSYTIAGILSGIYLITLLTPFFRRFLPKKE